VPPKSSIRVLKRLRTTPLWAIQSKLSGRNPDPEPLIVRAIFPWIDSEILSVLSKSRVLASANLLVQPLIDTGSIPFDT
jgi:hypothetical protein